MTATNWLIVLRSAFCSSAIYFL